MVLTRKKDRVDALASTSTEGRSLAASAFRRLRRSPVFLTGAVITALFVLIALFSPLLAPHDPAVQIPELIKQTVRARNQFAPPQGSYLLGGDQLGRDLFSRLLVGSQQTLLVGVLATLIGLTGGLILGTLAGATAGWVDTTVMRFVDVLLSIPNLLLAVTISALFLQANQFTVIVAVAIVQIPVFARLLRGTMLAQRASDHVLAARALGVKRSGIVFRHMLPNSLGPVFVQATIVLATSIIDAAGLSFLGLGNPNDDSPEWGQMLSNAQQYITSGHADLAFWPACAIVVVALGFTLMGESARDALDPKNRR
ncbi:ABC transporter permease [Sciscionella sediminilitoris]|uniref:ABC transporter permease n=1 Tax=Sciscionella sediminilitoris TaxID=1445613 RepID=UPI0004DF9EB0|nr:ABC transporter permease [Sciscionella sp. SE31]